MRFALLPRNMERSSLKMLPNLLAATYNGRYTGIFGSYNAISLVEEMNVTDNLCGKVAQNALKIVRFRIIIH